MNSGILNHSRNDSDSTSSETNEPWNTRTKGKKGKYKTEICRKWENGACEYKEKCNFAHGEHELRKPHVSASYKTKKCTQFFSKGFCAYGSRCQFSHEVTELKTAPSSPKVNSIEFVKRLPIFMDLERRNIC